MEKFKDRLNREWLVEVDNSMIADLREAGLDLAKFPRDDSPDTVKAFTGELMGVLMDPERLGNILSVMCQEQILERKLDAREFARGFNADALCAASDAVLLAAFDHVFRRPELRRKVREMLPKMWAKVGEEASKL
ncbi:MAG: hypothetical protein U0791_23250 [Gemmataceae bacterium]